MYTNYNNIKSKYDYHTKFDGEEINEEDKVFADPNNEVIDEEVIPESLNKNKEPRQATAIVTNCKKLNIRKFMDRTSEVIAVVDVNSELVVEEIYTEWAKVYTSFGIPGYVMSKYIKM